MKITAVIAMLLVLPAITLQPAAMAQNQSDSVTIEVIGTGRIFGEDISTARDQAISDCLVTAVSLVASELLSQTALIQSFQDINRLLFSSADRFVQDYKVLTEATTGRVYRVMVQATLSGEEIRELLSLNNILVQNEAPLRILILIAEKHLEDLDYSYWWDNPFVESVSEAGLTDTLRSRGFAVVDHGQLWPPGSDPVDIETGEPPGPEMTDAQAAAFGAWFDADVVVVGNATAKLAPNVLGDELRSYQGALSVRAVLTETGEVLTKDTQSILIADSDGLTGSRKALLAVGTRMGNLFGEQIQTAWREILTPGPIVATIAVEGDYQLAHLEAFRRILTGMPGVNDLQIREMTPVETILALDYEGTTQSMAEALLLESFKGFGLHIREATSDTIRLSLISD